VPKVLVVDDSELDRRLLGRVLEKRGGWEISFAVDGHDALRQFESGPPDIVLTDLQMPDMDGLELVTAIKKDFPATPVVLITGAGSEDIAAEALRRGAASYVPKRNVAEDLIETVQHVLASVRQDRDDRAQWRLMHHLTADVAEFDLATDLELIRSLVTFLQHNLRCLPLGDEAERLRVSLAVEEALNNAYYHGSLEVGTGGGWPNHEAISQVACQRLHEEPFCDRRIQVRTRISRSTATFVIRDEGPGFDHARFLADLSTPVGSDESTGRGIVLMRAIMDEVRYNAKGNEVTLVKHSRAAAATDGENCEPVSEV
jgi:CheY-like chemotaxis protein/anti-sigma regulatory factor (Ser/Thr protein kinase)